MKFTYLDWAATALPNQEAQEFGQEIAREHYANPSALHGPGKQAAAKLAEFREEIAGLLGCAPKQLIFTAGGSESNTILFSHLLTKPRKGGIVTSRVEHASVWETAALYRSWGYDLKLAEAASDGEIPPEQVLEKCGPDTDLVSIMLVNNETGRVQDIPAIAGAIRHAEFIKRRVHIHTDAVQALGKIPFKLENLGADSASFSGHKIGAPRGIGLLYLKHPLETAFRGGGQEFGVRPGTENLAGAAALCYCLKEICSDFDSARKRVLKLNRELTQGLRKIPGVRLLPDGYDADSDRFVPHILKCSFPPLPGEVMQRVLSDKGFAVSTGSACASNKKRTNRVMKALGIPAQTAESSIRLSIGSATTENEIRDFLAVAAAELGMMKEQI